MQPTGIQREYVVEDGDADLGFQLASDLSIQSVSAGGKAERQGIRAGMRLGSFQGQSTLAVPCRDLMRRVASAPRPCVFVLEEMHRPEHTSPTVFELAQRIKSDVRNTPLPSVSSSHCCMPHLQTNPFVMTAWA